MPVPVAMTGRGGGSFLLLRLLDDERLGGQQHPRDRGGVDQRGPGHLHRVQHALGDQVAVLAGGGVEALADLALADLRHDDVAVVAAVLGDPAQRLVSGLAHDARADRLVAGQAEIENTDSDYDREKLQERLAKLSGGVAVIKVGAATEVELKEKKHRIEDAISATRAAIEEGIIAGGGSALVHAASALSDNLGLSGDEATGVRIVAKAVDEPLRWIAQNGGDNGYVVVAKVRDGKAGEGYNAATGEYGDLVAQGVLDPVKVTRSALVNATSIAAMLLTTETLVVERPEEEEPAAAGHGHGHGH